MLYCFNYLIGRVWVLLHLYLYKFEETVRGQKRDPIILMEWAEMLVFFHSMWVRPFQRIQTQDSFSLPLKATYFILNFLYFLSIFLLREIQFFFLNCFFGISGWKYIYKINGFLAQWFFCCISYHITEISLWITCHESLSYFWVWREFA